MVNAGFHFIFFASSIIFPFLSFTLQLIFRRYKAVIIIAVLLAIFTNPILSLFLVSLAALDALLNHPPAPFVRYPKNWHHQLTLQLYTQKSRNALVSYSIAHRQESLWALLFFRKKPIQQIKRIILYIFRRELHFKIQRLVFCPENSRSIYLVRIFYQESGNKHQEAIPFNSLEEAQVMVQILISANRLYRLQASKSSESNFQIDTQ